MIAYDNWKTEPDGFAQNRALAQKLGELHKKSE